MASGDAPSSQLRCRPLKGGAGGPPPGPPERNFGRNPVNSKVPSGHRSRPSSPVNNFPQPRPGRRWCRRADSDCRQHHDTLRFNPATRRTLTGQDQTARHLSASTRVPARHESASLVDVASQACGVPRTTGAPEGCETAPRRFLVAAESHTTSWRLVYFSLDYRWSAYD